MQIAICEDHAEEAAWLTKMIHHWAKKRNVEVEVSAFADAETFFFTLEDTVYDALFLDIIMPGEDGVALAKRLRKSAYDVPIVFVTGEKEYALEGYEVAAVNYLLKPIEEKKVSECLDRIYQTMDTTEPFVILHTDNTVVKILQKDIYKIEVFGHKLIYFTAKGEYMVNSTLKVAEKELAQGDFISCHRGVLVGLRYVDSIGRDHLVLADMGTGYRTEVPVSRRLYNIVNEAFIQYYV